MFLIVELYRLPLSKSRRVLAYIDRNIPDCSLHAADQLGLPWGRLKMESADRFFYGKRNIVLDKENVNALLDIKRLSVAFKKKSPFVLERAWDNPFEARNAKIENLHVDIF